MDFTLKFLKAEKENQVFSPINIAHAFGLLLHGAGGDTEKEISNILGYGKSKAFNLTSQMHAILNLDQSRGIEIIAFYFCY